MLERIFDEIALLFGFHLKTHHRSNIRLTPVLSLTRFSFTSENHQLYTNMLGFRSLSLDQIYPRNFVNCDINISPTYLKTGGHSPAGPTTICHFIITISPIISISDGLLLSTCIGSLASMTEKPIVAVGKLNCSLTCSFQRAGRRSLV